MSKTPSPTGSVVVTGGAGFIGRALVARLVARGLPVTALLRRPSPAIPGAASCLAGEITAETDWAPILAGARAVVHLANRAHASLDAGERGWIEAEAAAAAHLARAAALSGVERVVLLSSIKVLGERTGERPFTAEDRPAPEDGYGLAKERIEEAMRGAMSGGASLTILRPPLVYGPGVKANFLAMLRLVDRGLPLPLAGIANRRSFVFIDNLVDLIEAALAPAAPGGTFLLRDDEEVSTPDLLRRIARQLGRPSRLFPCPAPLLRLAAGSLGRGSMADRLLQSLRIDDSATRARFGWSPQIGLDEGLAATCRWYREAKAGRSG